MAAGAGRRQQVLPMPWRAESLWRGCCWAVNCGIWRGRASAGTQIEHDSQTKNRGRLNGISGSTQSVIRQPGRLLSSNTGQTGDEWIDYVKIPIPQTGIYYWQDTGGMTLVCVCRFSVVDQVNQRILTKRFGTAANLHGGALSFSNAAGQKFEFSYCNGVNTQSIFGTTTPIARAVYVLVGRHWGNNVNSRAELWVNGKLEATNAAPATYPAYHSDPPIIFFNDSGSGDTTMNGYVSMGGLWRRPITTNEIARLNTNPYVMWLQPPTVKGLPFGSGGTFDGCRCGGPWLHAWNGLS